MRSNDEPDSEAESLIGLKVVFPLLDDSELVSVLALGSLAERIACDREEESRESVFLVMKNLSLDSVQFTSPGLFKIENSQ
jgi:hypothetical protein